jgi:predicted  nucleic acid-binding Zn-ribbon protein
MPIPFETQYRCLAELKEIDERAFRIEKEAEKIPEQVQRQEAALTQRRQELDTAKSQTLECEKRLRSAERELKEKEDSLFKAEGKMMEVKTNEEYQAAMKENQTQKQAKSVLEDRVLQMIADVEEQKQQLVLIEKVFKEYEDVILGDKKRLTSEHQDLMKELEGLLRQRSTFAAQLDPDTNAIYQRIVGSGKGVAVATTDQGKCLACNIQIRPQIYNEILGHKAIHRCANCGRLLIVPAHLGEAARGEHTQAK